MDEDDGMERGDEVPYYPPIGSPEWERRMLKASADLLETWEAIHGDCIRIDEDVTKITRELQR